ncbi:MAG: hypothetical protein LLG14_25855 [Nocardiaceae bacterium]|nr:hypothetical protein [Nocardiaceae bacterium]
MSDHDDLLISDDEPIRRPHKRRAVAWVMFGLMFVGPLVTVVSVLQLAPLLLVTVSLLGAATIIYFAPRRENDRPTDE